MDEELFELELVGGALERRYRAMRPEVEAMPWGTLETGDAPPEQLEAARQAWTGAAFQEHRTGAACAATLRSLIEARAPIDLVSVATRFPLDEMVHVELCARIAMELGGAVAWSYRPDEVVAPVGEGEEPLLKAAHQVVAFFCVGEALSIPLRHSGQQRGLNIALAAHMFAAECQLCAALKRILLQSRQSVEMPLRDDAAHIGRCPAGFRGLAVELLDNGA